MIRIKDLRLVDSKEELARIPEGKVLINTINAFSYNNARKDALFEEALMKGDYLIPDGASIVKACRRVGSECQPKERVAGFDLFEFEMSKLNAAGDLDKNQKNPSAESEPPSTELRINAGLGANACASEIVSDASTSSAQRLTSSATQSSSPVCDANSDSTEAKKPFDKLRINSDFAKNLLKRPTVMFMGSSEKVLGLIVKRAAEVYPNVRVVTYSPPYKPEFTKEDNDAIVRAINEANPDLLWIGMTAPKQEKWTYSHWQELQIHCHVGTIGAVFDFFAGTYQRAPLWWQEHSLEWLYRLIKEPKRMWRRYIIGNAEFLWYVLLEKVGK